MTDQDLQDLIDQETQALTGIILCEYCEEEEATIVVSSNRCKVCEGCATDHHNY